VNGNAVQGSFTATVASGVPVFTVQPVSQTVATGNTVVFHAPATGAASFQWERNGVPLPGATSSTLVINDASAADVGTYVNVAANSVDTVRSSPAILTVVSLPPTAVGRLSNLSILTRTGSGA